MKGERIGSNASGAMPGGRGKGRWWAYVGWLLGATVAFGVAVAAATVPNALAIALVVGLVASTVYLTLRVRGLEALRVRSHVSETRRLHEEIERARRFDYSFALMRLDVDAHVDSEFDATLEDEILPVLRITDTLIRNGRGTFVVLSHMDDADTVRERLSHACPQANGVFANSVVALFPRDGVTADGLFEVCNQRASSAKVPTSDVGGAPS